jgi:hypothetical protein
MTLKIPRIHVLQPLREQDISIMATLSSSTLTAKEINIINNTRIFLQVTSLAEISDNQGTSIHQSYITDQPPKRRTNLNGTSTLIWPKQPAPNRRMWRVWLKGLKHFCKPSSWILKTALGQWHDNCHHHRTWYASYDSSNNIVTDNTVWTPTMCTPRCQYFQKTEPDTSNASITIPAIPTVISTNTLMVPKTQHLTTSIRSNTPWYSQLHQSITMHNLNIELSSLTLRVTGKTSTADQRFHWVLTQNYTIIMSQTSAIPQTCDHNTQLPALYGIASCLAKLQLLGWKNDILIYTDSETNQMLKQTNKPNLLNNCKKFITDASHLNKRTFLIDNSIELDIDITDQDIHRREISPVMFPTTEIEIYINHKIVWQQLQGHIRLERHKQPVFTFFRHRYKWHPHTINLIDWALHDQVLQKTKQKEIFNLKFIHRWLPVASHGSMTPMQPTCLRCNSSIECQDHWYQCTHDPQHFKQQYETFLSSLQASGLHTTLQTLVLKALYHVPDPHSHEVDVVVQHQTSIGWDQFCRGRIAATWILTQNRLTSNSNGKSILTKLLALIFSIMHERWMKRNEDLHGNNTVINERQCKIFLHPRVQHLYDNKKYLPAHDQQILDQPIDEIFDKNPMQIEKWLSTNESYLLQSLKRENSRTKTKTHNITKFFPVIRTNRNHTQTAGPQLETKQQGASLSTVNSSSSHTQTIKPNIQTPPDPKLDNNPRRKNDLRPP